MTATMVNKQTSRDVSTDTVMRELKRVIETMKYGVVTIKVHNGRITQAEITEKRRFNEPLELEKGDGI